MAEATNPITTASNPREDWSHLSPQEIVRRTRCEADDWVDIGAPATWRTCCDLILRRLKAASAPSPETCGDLPADLQAAYDAGFEASGEGWNGEYLEGVMREGGYKDGRSNWINGYIFDVVAARSVIRSGKLVASTGSGEETKGADPYLTETTEALVARLEHELGVKGINSVFRRALAIAKGASSDAKLRALQADADEAMAGDTWVQIAPPASPEIAAAQRVLNGLDLNNGSPEQQAGALRDAAEKWMGRSRDGMIARAEAIEAALRTLQAAGEVRNDQ